MIKMIKIGKSGKISKNLNMDCVKVWIVMCFNVKKEEGEIKELWEIGEIGEIGEIDQCKDI